MALATSNITPRLANAELGNPFGVLPSNLQVDSVCAYASQNQYSFLGPWNLQVDANKVATVNYGVNNYKLGDFRGYNHSAATPAPQSNYTQYWGPGGATVNITISVLPGEVNILNAASGYSSSALRWCFKFYSSSAARIAGTSPVQTLYSTISWNTVTAPTGHTRSQTQKPGSTQIISLTGVTTTYSTLYLDTYVSDISGNRLLTLGGSIAGGYTDITMTENQLPTLAGGANYSGSLPAGYTALWPAINSASTPRCTDATLNQANGQTTYSFYLNMVGISGITNYAHQVTSCTVSLKVGGVTVAIKTSQALGYTAKTLISGTVPGTISGGNFSYNEAWTVEVTSITWGASSIAC